MTAKTIRIAAVGDIHCTRRSKGVYRPTFTEVNRNADILLLCGDLTDYGQTDEAHVLAEEIRSTLNIPVVAVLGNHDHESGIARDVHNILEDAGVIVLDGEHCEISGVHFAGTKGFGGGFGKRAIGAWGEQVLKDFVHTSVREAEKLNIALTNAQGKMVVLLHYSPVAQTVEGEPLEIYPFLGSSYLEETINRHNVAAVFHGHAHHGSLEGRTADGVPVYNVAMPLLKRQYEANTPYRILELEI